MKSEHLDTLQLGAGLGAVYCLGSHLTSFMKDLGLSPHGYLILFAFHFGLSLLCLFFSTPRQVIWFRRAWLIPWGSIWGVGLAALWLDSDALAIAAMVGAMVVTPAPLVWAAGAWWIWSRDGIRQRGW
jgi:hypothetical protein